MEDDKTPDLADAIVGHPGVKMGALGVICVFSGLLWVVLVPTPTMFGVGEFLAIGGGVMVLSSIWRAAYASMDAED